MTMWHIASIFLLFALLIIAGITRFWDLASPASTVFDEVHFGYFASLYVQRIFFMDVHPPLGKLVFASILWLNNVTASDFSWQPIGTAYHDSNPMIPYVAMRAVSALSSVLTITIVVALVVRLGFSTWSAILAGFLLVCDTTNLTHSRFIFLDAMLLFWIILATWANEGWRNTSGSITTTLQSVCLLSTSDASIKMATNDPRKDGIVNRTGNCVAAHTYSQRIQPKTSHISQSAFNLQWWLYLIITGCSLGFAISIKFTGLSVFFLVYSLAAGDLWELWGDQRNSLGYV